MSKREAGVLDNLKLAFLIMASPWLVFALDLILPFDLNRLGILPRNFIGLRGIILSPFLHAGIPHLLANSGALFFLSFLGFSLNRSATFRALAIIVLLGGAGVWVFGAPVYHIGASGVVFGLFGYLLASGLFHKDIKAIIVSALVFFLYGGLVFSFLRVMPGISWAAHFWGFVAGLLAAWLTRPKK
ncbi:rhomboid family intramembrane serine protease [Dethiosulfatarculus sandiegensis]|uniref:Rhomboid family protein n=1 Tax=Dethiosulfatarculus sandiegensis TaxID=1429043 RepID=A0A0D2J7R9_9BACT|nr:rhomboid family intramembrane serine protease [Dethiosulfatarculus sandiegensis]KIX14254.1 rhomboid family protein [Dethiosulfatarculus sandiegensis]